MTGRNGTTSLHPESGFSLLEMSLVLVIVGLLVGAVVGGKAMKSLAQERALIGQIESYKTAVTTFKLKYNELPGDMRPQRANSLGLATRAGSGGHGDGDERIECSNYYGGACINGVASQGEMRLFWNDLARAGFVDGGFNGNDCTGTMGANDCAIADAAMVAPAAKIGVNNIIAVYGDLTTGTNYFNLIGGVSSVGAGGDFTGMTYAITPEQAYRIDFKIDDGVPFTGLINAVTPSAWVVSPALATAAVPANGVCVSNASGNPYNVSVNTGANLRACSLRIGVK